MELLCIGLSYKTAPLPVREKLAFTVEQQVAQLKALENAGAEALLLSTCNRVEFYVGTPTVEAGRELVRSQLTSVAGHTALDYLYEHQGEAALVHLFRVAASLDSMVIGEPQILGQVKDAFELAQKAAVAKGELSKACHAAFSSAKRVRSETGVGRAAVSMASAAVNLARKIFGSLSGKTALVVGAGEMAELAARHLSSAGASRLWLTNRTFSRAEELAAQVKAEARPFEQLFATLAEVDVVVSCTASTEPIFTKENVSPTLKARKFRRLLFVDLAVPRDVATDVNTLENVYAVDVDDIQEMLAENAAARAAEAAKAEAIVAEEVARFVRAKAVRDGVPVLAQLRARADEIKRAEIERTLANLRGAGIAAGWSEAELRKTVEALANALVNKLLHQPTARLRAVGPSEDSRLADAAAELFGLDSAAPGRRTRTGEVPVISDPPRAAVPNDGPPAAAWGGKR